MALGSGGRSATEGLDGPGAGDHARLGCTQGLEFDVVVAWHPLAGQLTTDEFHLDPGRLCVMLTRHRHGCVVVGRVGDADLLGPVPPLSAAWAGYDDDPHVDGWFAHRRVLDQRAAFAITA